MPDKKEYKTLYNLLQESSYDISKRNERAQKVRAELLRLEDIEKKEFPLEEEESRRHDFTFWFNTTPLLLATKNQHDRVINDLIGHEYKVNNLGEIKSELPPPVIQNYLDYRDSNDESAFLIALQNNDYRVLNKLIKFPFCANCVNELEEDSGLSYFEQFLLEKIPEGIDPIEEDKLPKLTEIKFEEVASIEIDKKNIKAEDGVNVLPVRTPKQTTELVERMELIRQIALLGAKIDFSHFEKGSVELQQLTLFLSEPICLHALTPTLSDAERREYIKEFLILFADQHGVDVQNVLPYAIENNMSPILTMIYKLNPFSLSEDEHNRVKAKIAAEFAKSEDNDFPDERPKKRESTTSNLLKVFNANPANEFVPEGKHTFKYLNNLNFIDFMNLKPSVLQFCREHKDNSDDTDDIDRIISVRGSNEQKEWLLSYKASRLEESKLTKLTELDSEAELDIITPLPINNTNKEDDDIPVNQTKLKSR